ncbi:MAG: hypothetical protein ABSA08_00785 [Acidimicrobiales bacterium]|jgi:hypothetical protein
MDPIIDVALAKEYAQAKASGQLPPKGSPERAALKRASRRVDPGARIAKAAKADYAARTNAGTTDADKLSDLRLAARVRQAFSPVASKAVRERAAHDPVLANTIANIERVRAATRAELTRRLPASASKALADIAGARTPGRRGSSVDSGSDDDDVDTCPACTGLGYLPGTAIPCGSCEGLGLILAPDPDDDDEIAQAVQKAQEIKRLAKRLVKSAGPDAKVMAKGSSKSLTLATDSTRVAKLSPSEAAAFRRAAAKALGVDPSRVTVTAVKSL